MEDKVTRYSAAAVVLAALALVLTNPLRMSQHDGIALAQVKENTENLETMIIRGHRKLTSLSDPNDVDEYDFVVYGSSQHGWAEEAYREGQLIFRWGASVPDQRAIVVIPLWKKYLVYPLTEQMIQMLETLSPKGFVRALLEEDCEKLGASRIDGTDVEGFRIRDHEFMESVPKFFFDIRQVDATLWIGVDSLLPVKIEEEVVLGKCLFTGFREMRVHEVGSVQECNVDLDPNLFRPEIPEDYEPLDFGVLSYLGGAEAGLGLLGVLMLPAGLVAWRTVRVTSKTHARRR